MKCLFQLLQVQVVLFLSFRYHIIVLMGQDYWDMVLI